MEYVAASPKGLAQNRTLYSIHASCSICVNPARQDMEVIKFDIDIKCRFQNINTFS